MQTVVSEEILGIRFKYFINDCMASNSIGQKKEWEPHITKFTKLYNHLFDIKNIIDIGANFGYHTLLFSRECSENVYAFEPQIQNFELLEYNLELNEIKNVIPHNYACGDQNCDIKMPIFLNCNCTLNMGDITPNVNISSDFSVTKSIVLDEYNFSSKIDLIKLDVQGWEKKVLIGATNLLKTHKPILIVEFEILQLQKTNTNCRELFNFIREQDYFIFYLDYEYPSDHICVHKDHLPEFRLKFKNHILPHRENNRINNNLLNGVFEKIVM
jgi:FkbM family methyltransferase